MQVTKLTTLFTRAKQIYQTEDFTKLLRRGFAFVLRLFFEYQTYYLSGHTAEDFRDLNEADFTPKIDNFTLKIISTNQEADELEADGLEFRSYVTNARDRLDKGAIAFCIFVGSELACIGWVALTQEAMDSLDEPPYKVDFANHESCTGRYWTNPKYRGEGLAPYACFNTFKFLHHKGTQVNRTAMRTGNISSVRATEKAGFKAYGEGRYLRILWWKSWREKPLTQG